MRFYQLPKEQWEQFFDDLAGSIVGRRAVDVEVVGPNVGDQIAAHDLSLNGITYDRKDDTLFIYSDGDGERVNHAISHPREIWVDFAAGSLSTIVVKEDGGQQQVVTIGEPIALPANVETWLRPTPA
mgnify:CR=1 FL=1